jgi:hypothetical protein
VNIRHELPDGKGVLIDVVCSLCGERVEKGRTCEVCGRTFCEHACFNVHLTARDEKDPFPEPDKLKEEVVKRIRTLCGLRPR